MRLSSVVNSCSKNREEYIYFEYLTYIHIHIYIYIYIHIYLYILWLILIISTIYILVKLWCILKKPLWMHSFSSFYFFLFYFTFGCFQSSAILKLKCSHLLLEIEVAARDAHINIKNFIFGIINLVCTQIFQKTDIFTPCKKCYFFWKVLRTF